MDTVIYKAVAVTLDEDLASQMKRNKDVEMETEGLREKLDMLRLKMQERQAFHSNPIGEKFHAYEQGPANSGPDNAHPEVTEEDDDKKMVYKPPFLGRLKGGN